MRIKTTTAVRLPAHLILGLSPKQADARVHALRAGDRKDEYVTTAPVQFKAGEEFQYLGDPELLPRDMRPAGKAKQAPVSKAEKAA